MQPPLPLSVQPQRASSRPGMADVMQGGGYRGSSHWPSSQEGTPLLQKGRHCSRRAATAVVDRLKPQKNAAPVAVFLKVYISSVHY